jgi:phage shock protein C
MCIATCAARKRNALIPERNGIIPIRERSNIPNGQNMAATTWPNRFCFYRKEQSSRRDDDFDQEREQRNAIRTRHNPAVPVIGKTWLWRLSRSPAPHFLLLPDFLDHCPGQSLLMEQTSKRTCMKRLYRSKSQCMLCGVCGWSGQYRHIDPAVIRITWAVISLFTGGIGLLAYIVSGSSYRKKLHLMTGIHLPEVM